MTPIVNKTDGTILKCTAHEEMIVGITGLSVSFKDFRESMERHTEKTDTLIKEISTANVLFADKVLSHFSTIKDEAKEYSRSEDTKIWQRMETMSEDLTNAIEERNEKLVGLETKFTSEITTLRQIVEKVDKKITLWGAGVGGGMIVINIIFWLLKNGILKIHI